MILLVRQILARTSVVRGWTRKRWGGSGSRRAPLSRCAPSSPPSVALDLTEASHGNAPGSTCGYQLQSALFSKD